MPPKSSETKQGGAPPVTKTVKVPAKLHVVGDTDVGFVPDKRVPDAFSWVVASGQNVRKFTVHHPVGITPLDGDDWVITASGEVPILLQRAVHPDAAAVETRRAAARQASAVSAGLARLGADGVLHYPGDNGLARKDVLKAARIAAIKTHPEVKGYTPTSAEILAQVPDDIRPVEETLAAHLRDAAVVRAAEEANRLPDYETCSGPLGDQKQTAVAYLKGKTQSQAIDLLVKKVFGM